MQLTTRPSATGAIHRLWPRFGLMCAIVAIVASACTPTPAIRAAAVTSWPENVHGLVEFVERAKGEKFLHPVEVVFQDEKTFDDISRTEDELSNAIDRCVGDCFANWDDPAAVPASDSTANSAAGRANKEVATTDEPSSATQTSSDVLAPNELALTSPGDTSTTVVTAPPNETDVLTVEKALSFFGVVPEASSRADASAAGIRLGFYDPDTQRLVVRGDGNGIAERSTIVHELTHALQHQHHGAGMDFSKVTSADEALARRSVFEADAVLVETMWTSELSDEDRASMYQDFQALSSDANESPMSGFAAYLYQARFFPYIHGAYYLRTVVEAEGLRAVGAMLDHPPSSTHSIMYPGVNAGAVALRPPADGHLRLGAVGWMAIFGAVLGPKETSAVVEAWRNDDVSLQRGCVTAAIELDPTSTRARRVIKAWADHVGVRSEPGDGASSPIQLTSCKAIVTPGQHSHDLLTRRTELALRLADVRGRNTSWAMCQAQRILPDSLAATKFKSSDLDARISSAIDNPLEDCAARQP